MVAGTKMMDRHRLKRDQSPFPSIATHTSSYRSIASLIYILREVIQRWKLLTKASFLPVPKPSSLLTHLHYQFSL